MDDTMSRASIRAVTREQPQRQGEQEEDPVSCTMPMEKHRRADRAVRQCAAANCIPLLVIDCPPCPPLSMRRQDTAGWTNAAYYGSHNACQDETAPGGYRVLLSGWC
jgi:hypothetical protein